MKRLALVVMAIGVTLIAAASGAAGAPDPLDTAAGGCVAGMAYDPRCDVNQDGVVDVVDIQLVANHWGQSGTWTPDAAGGWGLTGNAGTIPGTHFLGTTDAVTLELRVNNQAALRIGPNAISPNWIAGSGGNAVSAGVAGATIGGGGTLTTFNRVAANFGTIGGGENNEARGDYATIGGGLSNVASGRGTTIAGGTDNQAGQLGGSGAWSAVGGGYLNKATGQRSTIPGGFSNEAAGDYSFAAGSQARADHDGAFVWGDSTVADIHSGKNDQFVVRANGGIWLGKTTAPFTATVAAGTFISTSTGASLTTGGAWTNSSGRQAKANFSAADTRAILARLAEVPIAYWSYKAEDAATRHIGPVAEDFYAAFGVGADGQHISTVDADGVALAAIQGLYQEMEARGARITALEAEKAGQQAQIDALQKQTAGLEARLAALEQASGGRTAAQAGGTAGLPLGWLIMGGGLCLAGLAAGKNRIDRINRM